MKKKKLPKRPKQSKPLATWERYEDKVNEVRKHNASVDAAAKKKKSLIEKTAKMVKK